MENRVPNNFFYKIDRQCCDRLRPLPVFLCQMKFLLMAILWLFEDRVFFQKNDPCQKSGAESKG